MTDSERHEMITEARVFYMAAPLIMPMIERMRKQVLNRMTIKHREGDQNFGTLVAELAVLEAIETQIKQKSGLYQTLEINSQKEK